MVFILTGSLSHVAWAAVRVCVPRRCVEGAVADGHYHEQTVLYHAHPKGIGLIAAVARFTTCSYMQRL